MNVLVLGGRVIGEALGARTSRCICGRQVVAGIAASRRLAKIEAIETKCGVESLKSRATAD